MVSLFAQSKKLGVKMNMQDWNQNVGSIIDYAQRIFPDVEIVTRNLNGVISKTNYGEVGRLSLIHISEPRDKRQSRMPSSA